MKTLLTKLQRRIPASAPMTLAAFTTTGRSIDRNTDTAGVCRKKRLDGQSTLAGSDDKHVHPPSARVFLFAVIIVLVSVPTALWNTARWTERSSIERLQERMADTLNGYVTILRSELKKFNVLPQVLSSHSILVNSLKNSGSSAATEAANRYLEEMQSVSGASDIYLMDPEGNTIAASNWRSSRSFVGRNFNFRPYFQQAMRGELGEYFAVGVTSKKRGFYYAYPVHPTSPLGVVVVKVDIEQLERKLSRGSEKMIVTDDAGVIFLSTEANWRLQAYGALSIHELSFLITSRRYDRSEHPLLPVISESEIDTATKRVTLREHPYGPATATTLPGSYDREYLVRRVHMPEFGWNLHVFSDMGVVQRQVLIAVSLAGLFIIAVLLAGYFIWQKFHRDRQHESIQSEERQRALKNAHQRLEDQVKVRTSELKRTNDRLKKEVADREVAETALKQTQAELVQAEKLAALGQMAAGINHELCQPLTAIRAYTENAKVFLRNNESDEALANLNEIVCLTERVSDIVQSLRTFSTKSATQLVPVSIRKAVTGSLRLLAPELRASGVHVTDEVSDSDLAVFGESIQLEQVLVNLICNAIQAMRHVKKRELVIAAECVNDSVSIHVLDTGSGINELDAKQIFEPFVTTKQDCGGLGLGLWISSSIARSFGGSLEAACLDSGGARFSLVLRAAASGQVRVA